MGEGGDLEGNQKTTARRATTQGGGGGQRYVSHAENATSRPPPDPFIFSCCPCLALPLPTRSAAAAERLDTYLAVLSMVPHVWLAPHRVHKSRGHHDAKPFVQGLARPHPLRRAHVERQLSFEAAGRKRRRTHWLLDLRCCFSTMPATIGDEKLVPPSTLSLFCQPI